VNRPRVSQAEAWRPDALRRLADGWDEVARRVKADLEAVMAESRRCAEFWRGEAADAAQRDAAVFAAAGEAVARTLITASVAATDGADQIGAARDAVLARVADARTAGFIVTDDGTVSPDTDPSPLLTAMSGGDGGVARDMLGMRATDISAQLVTALDRLGAADADAAHDIDEAFASVPPAQRGAPTVPAGARPVEAADVVAGWPAMSQDRIAGQIAAMTPDQRDRLIAEFPRQTGNTDGVPWAMRIAANRVNIAGAIVDERGTDPESTRRIAFYRSLLGEVDDPARTGRRIDRQILAFDPGRASLIELNGDLATARSVAVLVPGLNTTIEDSRPNTQTARRFVSATRGDVATISYLGGPFPRGDNVAAALVAAADPRYALDMAPRLVAFSEDVDRAVSTRSIPVTYVGHSYGGSILGTAEALGLTADRTLYLAAAGAGVGVDAPADWHNRNPDVLRFAMTAPGDFIQAVQGIPVGPHGADPDHMPGVIHLATGHYDDGRPMTGWQAHSDVVNWPSDAWRNVLAVITGDSETLHQAG
jgi:uncharacterized protein YukE